MEKGRGEETEIPYGGITRSGTKGIISARYSMAPLF